MSVLENLYNGNINPSERYIKKGSEYQKINKQLIANTDELMTTLSEKEKELFEKICDNIYKLNYISEKESFIEGFRLGTLITEEVYNFNDFQLLNIN